MKTLQMFIDTLTKYVDTEKEYTDSQLAQIIGKAILTFFDESDTAY